MKIAKNILLIVIVILVGGNSVYFAKLDETKASRAQKDFDAKQYAEEFWKKLIPAAESAISLETLITSLSSDPAMAFDKHSHALGIGNLRYFLVKGRATAETVEADYVTVSSQVRLSTEFIFGNAVRDASGLIDINDFVNTMDFNNVSTEINKIVREKVVPPFKSTVREGDKVEFIGAVELNKEHLQLKNIEVIPIQLTIVK
ncbi:MAG TPA: DUF2291 domain-containing protein [Cyclobacteriaceae bacterium]